ncbi:MAG: hypothetical protein ACR2GZ_01735 [Solirubrobacteraceae bacterium]
MRLGLAALARVRRRPDVGPHRDPGGLARDAELRAERAVQTKLDATASSLLEERRRHRGDAEPQLEESTGAHEEI